jgi:hypothetical protein
VRYGRARLTVFRFGGLTDGDLGAAIRSFEGGEIEAEALAWSFVRHRVVKHTPSFSWEDADLSLLLDRVVGVSTDPTFESSAPEEVARVLVAGAKADREARERMRERSERFARSMSDRFGFGPALRPILEPMQHALAARFATNMKFQGILDINRKLVESGFSARSPALFRASELARKSFAAKSGTEEFGVLGMAGKGNLEHLVPKGITPELLGLRSPRFPKMFAPALASRNRRATSSV